MKSIKYNFLLLLIVGLFNMPFAHSQSANVSTENQNIQQFIQIWGLMKYKSQQSMIGKFDADKVFLSLIDAVKNADKKQFNQLMLTLTGSNDLVASAGNQSYNPDKLNSDKYLLKNLNYNWIKDKSYTKILKQQLTALSHQTNLNGKHQYISALWYESELPNEAPYTSYTFDKESMNLLALAKAWNAVEYLFPYKYQTDKDWTKILLEMVPVFRNISDRTSYEKSILMLATATNDTHAGEFMEPENMKTSSTIFNVGYYPPFDYKAYAEGIIITKFIDESLAKGSELKAGDEIIAINGIKVAQWLKERSALLPASNNAVKYRELSTTNNNRADAFAFSNLKNDTLNVKVKRAKDYLHLKLVMLNLQDKQSAKLIENHILEERATDKAVKGIENITADIALVRAGNTYDKDLPTDGELVQLSAELKSKKAIIFDMRKYPQSPGLFSYYIPLLLGKAPFAFARYYAADPQYPGVFKHKEELESYMYVPKDDTKPMGNLYTGKIIILVNENTQSMAEWFTMMLRQFNNNTTVIGSQTAGADGDVKRLTLPGAYQFSFTGNGIFYPNGDETQRIGIKPDIHFEPSAKDLAGTTDALLQKAIDYINLKT